MFVSKEEEEDRLKVMAAKFPKGRIAIALKNVLFRFGTAQLIRTFSLTCKDYKLYCDRSLVWRTALYMDISPVLAYTLSQSASDIRAVDWKKAYKAALFEKYKGECHHMITLQKAMKAVQDYQGCRLAEKDDIIGLVADMVMFDDPDVARCLSEKRQQGLNMLLMKDRIHDYSQALHSYHHQWTQCQKFFQLWLLFPTFHRLTSQYQSLPSEQSTMACCDLPRLQPHKHTGSQCWVPQLLLFFLFLQHSMVYSSLASQQSE